MLTPEEIRPLEERLRTRRRALSHALQQYASFDPALVPFHVVEQIDEARVAIRHLKEMLRDLGVAVDDHPDDEAAVEAGAPRDPYRTYVEQLERRATLYLRRQGYERADRAAIQLQSDDAPDEVVATSPEPLLLSLFEESLDAEPGASFPAHEPAVVYGTFDEAFEYYNRRLLLLGGPGTGKTITLLAFVRDMARRRLADPSTLLPIYVRSSSWQPNWNPEWEPERMPKLLDWVAHSFPSRRDIEGLMRAGQVLLILDGLDELSSARPVSNRPPETASLSGTTRATVGAAEREQAPAAAPDQADRKLASTYDARSLLVDCVNAQLSAHVPLVISCRIDDYHQLQGRLALNGAVRLRPLTDEQIRGYLRELPDLWAALEANPTLLDIARIPLLLYLFTMAYEGTDAQTRQLRGQSQAELRDDIFDKYFERRYEREQKKAPPDGGLPFSRDELRSLLERLALDNLEAGEEGQITPDDLEAVLPLERCDDFAMFASDLHILAPADVAQETFRFIHLLLRDYFAFQAAEKGMLATDPQTRRTAALALTRLSATHPRAVDLLVRYVFSDDDDVVRAQIVEAIGNYASPPATDLLIQALSDGYWLVRKQAALALGRHRDPRAVGALIRALRDDDADVRSAAAASLGHLGDAHAIEALVARLGDSELGDVVYGGDIADSEFEGFRQSRRVGNIAAEALVQIGPAAQPALLSATAHADQAVRLRAAMALGWLPGATPAELVRLLRDPVAEVRAQTVRSLGALRDPDVIPALIDCMGDDALEVRAAAQDILAGLGTLAIDPLIARLGVASADLRVGAATVLGMLGDRRATMPLIASLSDIATEVRVAAAESLGSLGDAQAVAPLIAGLGDANHEVRQAAAASLRALGDTRAVEPLIARLRDRAAGVRLEAAEALGRLGDARAVEPLIVYLRRVRMSSSRRGDAGDEVQAAIAALGALGDARAAEPLIDCLQDRRADVRGEAIQALSRLRYVQALPAIIACLGENDIDYQVAADLLRLGMTDVDIFRQTLAGSNPAIRMELVASIWPDDDQDDGQVASLLLLLIDDPDREVRLEVIQMLGDYEVIDAVGLLATVLRASYHDAELSRALIETLGSIRTESAIGPIFRALLDTDNDAVRLAALDQIEELEMLDDPRVDAPLAAMRRSPTIAVRVAAVRSLSWQQAHLQRIDLDLAEEIIMLLRDRAVDTLPDADAVRGGLFSALAAMAEAALPRQDSLRVFCRALSCFIDAKGPAAYALVSRAIAAQPDRWYYYYWRAEIATSLPEEDLEQSLADCVHAAELRPGVSFVLSNIGTILFALARYDEAIARLEQAIALNSEDGSAYSWRGQAFYAQEAYAQAVDDFTRAVELRPEDADTYSWRGQAFYAQEAYAQAVDDFTRAVELRPEDADTYSWRGQAFYAQEAYAQAVDDFTRAVELRPEDADNHYWRGRAYFAQEAYAQAEADFARAVALQPEDADNHSWRGLACFERGAYAQALADFTRAVELQPAEADNYYWRGRVAYIQGVYAQALADFTRAVELQPAEADNYYWRGRVAYIQGVYAQAEADFTRAVELQPAEADNYYWRGLAHWQMASAERAEADLAQAEELIPQGEDAYLRERLRARIALLHQRLDVALQHYTTAAEQRSRSRLSVDELNALEASAAVFPDNAAIMRALEWLRANAR